MIYDSARYGEEALSTVRVGVNLVLYSGGCKEGGFVRFQLEVDGRRPIVGIE